MDQFYNDCKDPRRQEGQLGSHVGHTVPFLKGGGRLWGHYVYTHIYISKYLYIYYGDLVHTCVPSFLLMISVIDARLVNTGTLSFTREWRRRRKPA